MCIRDSSFTWHSQGEVAKTMITCYTTLATNHNTPSVARDKDGPIREEKRVEGSFSGANSEDQELG